MHLRTIDQIGEVGLIDRIRRRLSRDSSVIVGIGDDAALLQRPAKGRLLFASDMLIEGVHFDRKRLPAAQIGWKALAVNISDIAAMGGIPHWAVVSIGLPPKTPVRFVDALYSGLNRCARRYHVSVVGGDTVRAPQVVIDVAIVGSVAPKHAVLRSGARVGDALFVTGALGGSYASRRHARFLPRLAEAQKLLHCVRVHALMDLSDGLAIDLWHMSRASKVALRIEAARIPVSRSARTLRHALTDGEDFELLFAVSRADCARVPGRIGSCPITRIGYALRRGTGVELQAPDGSIQSLAPEGFRHF